LVVEYLGIPKKIKYLHKYMNIAIPSYKRSNNLRTIKFLEKENVPAECITIFVANPEEEELYKTATNNKYKIVVGVLGIDKQRNFISNYYKKDEIIISMDDDILDIKHKHNLPFIVWVERCVTYLKESPYGMLGASPSNDARQNILSTTADKYEFKEGNYLVVGVFHIYKNDGITCDLAPIDDYDKSMQYLIKYGKIIRCWHIYVKHNFATNNGGLQEFRTIDVYKNAVEKFYNKYSKYVYLVDKDTKSFGCVVPIIRMRRKFIE